MIDARGFTCPMPVAMVQKEVPLQMAVTRVPHLKEQMKEPIVEKMMQPKPRQSSIRR